MQITYNMSYIVCTQWTAVNVINGNLLMSSLYQKLSLRVVNLTTTTNLSLWILMHGAMPAWAMPWACGHLKGGWGLAVNI